MSITHSATIDRRCEPIIGEYRRSADCASRSGRLRPVDRRPNYTLRRLSVGAGAVLALAVVVVVLSSLLASLGGDPASAAGTSPAEAVSTVERTHVARPGDTLWSIAHQYRGDVGHERYVDALVRLNGGAGIVVGQAVSLP